MSILKKKRTTKRKSPFARRQEIMRAREREERLTFLASRMWTI